MHYQWIRSATLSVREGQTSCSSRSQVCAQHKLKANIRFLHVPQLDDWDRLYRSTVLHLHDA